MAVTGATFAVGAQPGTMHVEEEEAVTLRYGADQTRDFCAATVHVMMERNAMMGTVAAMTVATTCVILSLDGRAVWTQRQELMYSVG